MIFIKWSHDSFEDNSCIIIITFFFGSVALRLSHFSFLINVPSQRPLVLFFLRVFFSLSNYAIGRKKVPPFK